MKYARPVNYGDGIRLIDVIQIPNPLPDWAADAEAFLEKMFESNAPEWKAAHEWFVLVDDDNVSGAIPQPDGTYKNPDVMPIVAKPNNPGNPYFGKKPMLVGDFWGLILLTYVAMANGDLNAGNDRYARLTESRRALGIVRIIDGQNQIDVDDKDGHFLVFLNMLQATDHEDGSGKLMTPQEAATIMQGWK